MLYYKEVTVPVNTPITEPYEFTLKVTIGMIDDILVFFPWGCAGLCYVRLIRSTWPIFPVTRNEWLRGNNIGFRFNPKYPISSDPPEIIIQAYNLDDTYVHHPIIGVSMNDTGLNPEIVKFMETFTLK